jgi:hypothetical protein
VNAGAQPLCHFLAMRRPTPKTYLGALLPFIEWRRLCHDRDCLKTCTAIFIVSLD